MKHKQLRSAVVLSLGVLITILLSNLVGGTLLCLLVVSGVLTQHTYWLGFLILPISCIILGSLLYFTVGQFAIKTIQQINNALGEIAKGNFQVRLSENSRVKEVQQIGVNFNRMAQELASTQLLQSDFIENVSHEFKTPISAIEGYTTLLEQCSPSDAAFASSLQNIHTATRRLANLCSNILLLSRLEHQGIAMKTQQYPLDEQIRECLLLLEPEWSKKDLNLRLDLPDCTCQANPELMAHVWGNLLGNGIKFAHPGSTLSVTLSQGIDLVFVSITDQGPEIPKEIQQRIFDKFYQADTSHTTPGNGLGLALAKRILALHGGEISVKSGAQETTFTVQLPLNPDDGSS